MSAPQWNRDGHDGGSASQAGRGIGKRGWAVFAAGGAVVMFALGAVSGGGDSAAAGEASATPTVTETVTPSPAPTVTVTRTAEPTATPTVTETITVTETAAPVGSGTGSGTGSSDSSRSSSSDSDSGSGSGVSYKNCSAVRAAGKAPLYRGEPGYARHLDRDGDGVACE
ncbi:excalibur calcium-binding domain-containing protein [Streptomyces monticola]|uniref:Excalibur calcium-binding domain-containing protein n=1 Tax=Streptomyces monticola TaxID=2666263 RepID=A0ABW2JBL7_9ACTN